MHNDNLGYAESFDEALEGLLSGQPPPAAAEAPKVETRPPGAEIPLSDRIRQANDAFEKYLQFLGEKQYSKAARELEQLESALKDLSRSTGESKRN
jgi:uncharacterized membrane protein (UPF0182 family)